MKEKDKEIVSNRKIYQKPKIEQVKLITEEAVLQSCKAAGTSGPGVKNCERPFQQCLQRGRT